MPQAAAGVRRASVAAYTVPTEAPESDGTLEWRSTTLVCVHLDAAGTRGFGYTYADRATAALIHHRLLPLVEGREPLDLPARFAEMARALRNLGRPGIASTAISAVDAAFSGGAQRPRGNADRRERL